jgi:hypothetical protein
VSAKLPSKHTRFHHLHSKKFFYLLTRVIAICYINNNVLLFKDSAFSIPQVCSPGLSDQCREASYRVPKEEKFMGHLARFSLLLFAALWLIPFTTAKAASAQPTLSTPVELTTLGVAELTTNLLDTRGQFHLLYTEQRTTTLRYQVVKSSGQSVQVVKKPVTLVQQADKISDLTLTFDSQGRLHAGWLEENNGAYAVRHVVVDDPASAGANAALTPQTLYQSADTIQKLGAGADGQGHVFYTWLDNSNGSPHLSAVQVTAMQPAEAPVALPYQASAVVFPHLLVAQDGTLLMVLLQADPAGGWDLTVTPYASTGAPLQAPIQVATQLHPGLLNTITDKDKDDFHFDPLAASLDAQQQAHIVWGAYNQLGYATLTLQPQGQMAAHAAMLSSATQNYVQPCLVSGPAQQTQTNHPAPVWLTWLDDSGSATLHPYFAQITAQGTLATAPAPLVGPATPAGNACPQEDTNGGLYITWQQYDEGGNYGLQMATTTVAPQIPWWVSTLGLNRDNPIEQCIFIALGSILLGAAFLLADLLATPVAAGIIKLGGRFHIRRLVLLVLSLLLFLVVDVWVQGFIATLVQAPAPSLLWGIIGGIVALALIAYLWYRRRKYPPETLGAIGQLLIASYTGAVVLAIPLIYVFTRQS